MSNVNDTHEPDSSQQPIGEVRYAMEHEAPDTEDGSATLPPGVEPIGEVQSAIDRAKD